VEAMNGDRFRRGRDRHDQASSLASEFNNWLVVEEAHAMCRPEMPR
jgi:hypothetical protein